MDPQTTTFSYSPSSQPRHVSSLLHIIFPSFKVFEIILYVLYVNYFTNLLHQYLGEVNVHRVPNFFSDLREIERVTWSVKMLLILSTERRSVSLLPNYYV